MTVANAALTRRRFIDTSLRLRVHRLTAGTDSSEPVLLSRWALRLSVIDRLEALVDSGNEASIRVLSGAGFRREALLRSYMEFEGRRGDAVLCSSLESDIERPTSNEARSN
jgi:hypothetical protein